MHAVKIQLPNFESALVLVAGDVMLDRYWHGATERISPEAPVPVVHVGGEEERPGGAGNVALNVTALGAAATLVAPTGDDPAADRLTELLERAGARARLLRQAGAFTVTKLRIISKHQQLIRLDFEDGFPALADDVLPAAALAAAEGAGAVVLSDYDKGALRNPQPLIRGLRAAGLPVLVDPKGRDFTRYAGASLITPNLPEFEAVAGPCPTEADLSERAARMRAELELDALLVTRGEAGMSLFRHGYEPLHLPTRAREVFDVTGAGDTVVGVLAAGLAAGMELPQATALANIAAGIVVGKLGTATVSPAELRRALHEQGGGETGPVTEEALLVQIERARARGERVVMTNGCFDLLHPGHVAYLEQARALGDRLVVAVNDDASVARLKGPARPVMPLESRMAVLAGLAAVDWVVPFSEDTPARLIGRVLPDLLVKGGDYRPEEVAGYDAVTAAGGEVRILDFLEGYSTTALVERLRAGTY